MQHIQRIKNNICDPSGIFNHSGPKIRDAYIQWCFARNYLITLRFNFKLAKEYQSTNIVIFNKKSDRGVFPHVPTPSKQPGLQGILRFVVK